MKNLLEILKKETESLKTQYVESTKQWAAKEFEYLVKWAIDYNRGCFGFGEASKKYYRLDSLITRAHYTPNAKDLFIEKRVKDAVNHYELSIEKLALRIEKKELKQESLKVVTSHVDHYIETTLTDGEKTVRAFTVLASGAVQRPHYRYLVK